jgi:hypothetical protein
MTDKQIGTLGGILPWHVKLRAKLQVLLARDPWIYHGEEDGKTVVYAVFVGDGHIRYMDTISHTAKHAFQRGTEFDERRREIVQRNIMAEIRRVRDEKRGS